MAPLSEQQQRRDTKNATPSSTWPIVGSVLGFIFIIIVAVGIFTYKRKKRSATRARQRLDSSSEPTTTRNASTTNTASSVAHRLSVRSVRSIITLPSYKEMPSDHEKVIGRAGERAGLDYIVESPETAEEVEMRRQEEVDAIYRVQQTRRRELEQRAELRRLQTEAENRGDVAEVTRLNREINELRARMRRRDRAEGRSGGGSGSGSGNASEWTLGRVRTDSVGESPLEGANLTSGELLAELQDLRSRSRRISEVKYGDLGLARHDGSRLRGESMDSDSRPLLDSSASMGGRISTEWRLRGRSRASSLASEVDRERSRSRASRAPSVDLAHQVNDGEVLPEPPSYEDDFEVHAGQTPTYADAIAAQMQATGDIANAGSDEPTRATSMGHSASLLSGDPMDRPNPSAVPLRLQTGITPPAIEVVSATPVQSEPVTPIVGRSHR